MLRSSVCTTLSQITYVFNGGENCHSIETEHNTCVVKGLDVHAFLARSTCKLYAGRFVRASELFTALDGGVGSADLHAIFSPIENIWSLGKNCKSISTSHTSVPAIPQLASLYWVSRSQLYGNSHSILCCRIISSLHPTRLLGILQ